jgi:hypothetical protein
MGSRLGSQASTHSIGQHPSTGSSWIDCCTRRSDGGACCDVTSPFGEDAFYREAFYDCDEGNRSHDRLFAAAREVARLKMRKGKVLAKYASFELGKRAAYARKEIATCIANKRALESQDQVVVGRKYQSLRHRDIGTDGDSWVGCTLEEWTGSCLPPTGEGPYWSKGTGTGLKVRCGPDYVKLGNKVDATGSMYKSMCVDVLKAKGKIQSIMGSLVEHPPQLQEYCEQSDCAGGIAMRWSPDCPLPRVICINLMLPYEAGLNPFGQDSSGCSVVAFFHIKPETMQLSRMPNPPAHIKLFKEFCDSPAGQPGGPLDCPARSLANRVKKGTKKDQQAGMFKAIAHVINPEDVHVPDFVHTYNGKPSIMAKCGYIVKDPQGEWMEVGIDVRGFNVLARKMLGSFRHLLPKLKIHCGFMIQGVEDTELPEGLLGDVFVHGIDMIEDPLNLDQ